MWPGDLAPDDADLGSTDFLLATVNVGDLLAEVEAIVDTSQYTYSNILVIAVAGDLLGGRGVINTLDLDQAGAGGSDMTRALVAQVTSPNSNPSAKCISIQDLPSQNVS